jgi:hypothetical protein
MREASSDSKGMIRLLFVATGEGARGASESRDL